MIGFGWAIAILKNLSLIASLVKVCSLRAPDERWRA